jgi:hypothetical protein
MTSNYPEGVLAKESHQVMGGGGGVGGLSVNCHGAVRAGGSMSPLAWKRCLHSTRRHIYDTNLHHNHFF